MDYCKDCALFDGDLQGPDGWCLLNQTIIEDKEEESCTDFIGKEEEDGK